MIKKGFTLIEMMVAVSIIAILAAIGFTAYNQSRAAARDAKRIADIGQISNALETFYTNNGAFPQPASCTTAGVNCQVSFNSTNFPNMTSYFSGGVIPNDPTSSTTYYSYNVCPGPAVNTGTRYVICATLSGSGNVNQKASVNACNFTYSMTGTNNFHCKVNKLQGT